jgi:predicted metal-dependent peptidase
LHVIKNIKTMLVKNIHEKLLDTIHTMLIDTQVNLPYYGEFNQRVNFHEQDSIGTCAVNFTTRGMNFYYSPKFLESLSQKEVNFITLHEDFHLLFDHPKRTVAGQFDHKISNIVQDMIINHIIWEDISHKFVEIPKSEDGKNMGLFVPDEYNGELIFEHLYMWFKDEQDKWKQKKEESQCQSCGGSGEKSDDNSDQGQGSEQGDNQGEDEKNNQGGKDDEGDEGNDSQKGEGQGDGGNQDSDDQNDGDGQGQNSQDQGQGQGGNQPCPDCNGTGNSSGQPGQGEGDGSYGPYGKNPSGGDPIDTFSKEKLFEDLENGEGEYLDKHIGDEVPGEMRESMVKDAMERLAARGLSAGNIEKTLEKLRKKRKDYLREIKRAVSNVIFGTNKQRTITKANRKGIKGLKGFRKVKTKINCILDTSGSMGGTFEKVLSFIYRNDIEVNLIEADTEVKWVQNIKNKKNLESLKISGLGGTMLQPGIDYVADNFNEFNTVVLTDGYCDSLDLSKIKGKVLIISIGVEVNILASRKKVKQIVVTEDELNN